MDKKGKPVIRTGVNVFVFNDKGQFVLGHRKGSHGAGTWGLPGGHIDFFEQSFEHCARREIKEETDFQISGIEFLTLMELHKCDGWEWFTWEEVKKLYEAQVAAEKENHTVEFTGKKLFSL
ncbi:NUDIX hydrolase domain-like protein [Aspergillus novoparasiticus]|uniref:NUDIX hydrolase domain-like protein n=1 Tax=Aspergillus novoparasiticus TaxID=986946 RepID=A0A5N6E628_9EURO|nr:NUDIX hydrolase domain-like protein [Aspergillus novoparasiticus]